MAVSQVVSQLEEDGGLHPPAAVPGHSHGQGDLVHDGEVHAVALVHQEVGVVPQGVHGPGAVAPVEPQPQVQRQVVDGQKVQQPPHAGLDAVALADLHGLPGGDALDPGEELRLLLQNPQGVLPEALHQLLRRGGAHALHHAGGEVAEDIGFRGGHVALHPQGLELLAVDGVGHPLAVHHQTLAGGGAGNGAHHGDYLAVAGHQAEDGVAVLLILEDEVEDGAVHGT